MMPLGIYHEVHEVQVYGALAWRGSCSRKASGAGAIVVSTGSRARMVVEISEDRCGRRLVDVGGRRPQLGRKPGRYRVAAVMWIRRSESGGRWLVHWASSG
jgi:hypothetical protein